MDVTSKGMGSIAGGLLFMSNNNHNIVLIVVAVTAVLVGTAIVVSAFFRFIARYAYKR